jgi:hypothetical protein
MEILENFWHNDTDFNLISPRWWGWFIGWEARESLALFIVLLFLLFIFQKSEKNIKLHRGKHIFRVEKLNLNFFRPPMFSDLQVNEMKIDNR